MPKKAEKGFTMRRCRECGIPRVVSFFVKWSDNGTIVQLFSRNFRVVILHHGFIDNLFSSIEAKLGLSIEHLAFEAQRNASKVTFEGIRDKIPVARLATRLKFARRIAVELFHRVSVLTGMCRSWTVEYVPGERGSAVVRNPFNIGLLAANIVGAFETLEGMPFEQTWEEESRDTYIISIRARGAKPEFAERMELAFAPLLPGSLDYNRCSRCKASTRRSKKQQARSPGRSPGKARSPSRSNPPNNSNPSSKLFVGSTWPAASRTNSKF